MKKTLRRLLILAAPIVWRKIRGRRSRHRWHGRHRWYGSHRWHGRPPFRRHKRRGIWL